MGSLHQNIIELNGKKYDAITGRLLADEKAVQNSVETTTPKGSVVDGIVRRPSTHTSRTHQLATHVAKPVQKSQTLMRSYVKKPNPLKKHTDTTHTSVSGIRKASFSTSPQRAQKAAQASKSPLVSHYGDLTHRSSVVKKIQELTVKHPQSHQTSKTTGRVSSDVVSASRSKHMAAAMIEKALASADSHEQVAPARTKRRHRIGRRLGISARALAISSTVLAGVLLGGFFAIQNVPNLSMRVASARAGFDATMPGYNPSGFSFKGPINYSPGQVTVSFKSNTDDRSYTVAERASNWNSDALLSNFIQADNKQYQTYLDRGRTLYIYDGSNATWVDNGVWYQIEGQSQMTTDQLVRIAASM